jgi:hypothetical protein
LIWGQFFLFFFLFWLCVHCVPNGFSGLPFFEPVWHGRNSYKRSSKLSQFIFHRGLIISVIQAVFSAFFYFAPIALYQGFLMMGFVFPTIIPGNE